MMNYSFYFEFDSTTSGGANRDACVIWIPFLVDVKLPVRHLDIPTCQSTSME